MTPDRSVSDGSPRSLAGKVLFITGASRGIGKAIALRAARDGACIAIAAKTKTAHPRLPGTIFSASEEIESAGGKALACEVDVRDEEQIRQAVERTVERFGGIDVLVNNAGAIHLGNTEHTPTARFDLMFSINARGAFLCAKQCLPHLKKADNPHILNLSPPLQPGPRWLAPHAPYTVSKYAMSMWVLGWAEEFRALGIAANALWPRTAIATSAVEHLLGEQAVERCRKSEIISDAAYWILTRESRTFTGNFCVDEDLLRAAGVEDFERYAVAPGRELLPDLFV